MLDITVTDANGGDFHALSKDAKKNDAVGTSVTAWTFVDAVSGFGWPVGTIQLSTVKRLGAPNDGKYGA